MAKTRKNISVEELIEYTNGFLSAKGGDPAGRAGAIALLEFALFECNRYRGYSYLGEDDVSETDLPGVRWKNYEKRQSVGTRDLLENTDPTRRRYA
jgi:hypothetical protein